MRKEYLIKSINFGRRGERSRLIIEEFLKKNGNSQLSALIRQLVVSFFDDKYPNLKKKALLLERQEIGKKISSLAMKKQEIDDKLNSLGVDPYEILN